MKIVLTLAAGLVIGLTLGLLVSAATISNLRRRVKTLRSAVGGTPKKKMETTKKVILLCLVNGFAWVWCSYILACLDKTQIAESLSQVAVTEIIGVVLAYCIKSAVENLSKNNQWPDKATATPPPEETAGEDTEGTSL